MAADGRTTTTPAPPRLSVSSPPTVGTLLTRAGSAAAADRHRGCSSPRSSLLSRILHRGRGGAGFGCRIRLFPRYCAKEDAITAAAASAGTAEAAKHEEEEEEENVPAAEVAAPTAAVPVVATQPPAPHGIGKQQDAALPASLGLGASLVLLLSRSAAELSRMAELRAEMERLLADASRADVRSCSGGRPSATSGDRTDCGASVVKGDPVVVARSGGGDDDGSRAGTANTAPASRDMDRMEAELQAELSRLQLQRASDDDDDEDCRDDDQLEVGPKRSASSKSHSTICSDYDDDNNSGETTETDNGGGGGGGGGGGDCDDDEEEDADDGTDGTNKSPPSHGGVSARELERRLHEVLQSRHEARIAELESALERARRKLRETEREACRWRDTAKLATRFADESRLR